MYLSVVKMLATGHYILFVRLFFKTQFKKRHPFLVFTFRLGKLACPRVNDDQKLDVDDQKLSSGRPHDYWILQRLFLFHWL